MPEARRPPGAGQPPADVRTPQAAIRRPPPSAADPRTQVSSGASESKALQFMLEHDLAGGEGFTSAGTFSARLKTSAHSTQTHNVPIFDDEIYVTGGDSCHISLDDQAVSRNLCMLRHLQVPKFPLEEVMVLFGRSAKHADVSLLSDFAPCLFHVVKLLHQGLRM